MPSPWCLGLQTGEHQTSEFVARLDPSSSLLQAGDKTGAQSDVTVSDTWAWRGVTGLPEW
jgi:hypothetical protein